jgi:hypothetical protein
MPKRPRTSVAFADRVDVLLFDSDASPHAASSASSAPLRSFDGPRPHHLIVAAILSAPARTLPALVALFDAFGWCHFDDVLDEFARLELDLAEGRPSTLIASAVKLSPAALRFVRGVAQLLAAASPAASSALDGGDEARRGCAPVVAAGVAAAQEVVAS